MMSMLQRSTMSHQHKKHRPLSRSSWMPSLSPKIWGMFGFQAKTNTASAIELLLTICMEIAACIFLYVQELPTPLWILETMFPCSKFLDMWHLGSSATIETSYGQDNAVPVGGSPLCRPLFSVSHSFSCDSYFVAFLGLYCWLYNGKMECTHAVLQVRSKTEMLWNVHVAIR